MANTFSPIDNPHVLVLISRGPQLKIRVLNFLDEAKVQIVDAQTSNVSNDLGYYSTRDGSFVENYILHNMYNPILGITAFNVWNYDEKAKTISLHHTIRDVDNFVQYPLSRGYIKSVENVLFFRDRYIICAKLTVRDEDSFPDGVGVAFFYSLGILIVNLNGEMLRNIVVHEFDDNYNMEIYLHENKFLFHVDESLFIFNSTLSSMLEVSSEQDKIEKYDVLCEANEREIMLFSSLELKKVELVYIADGSLKLKTRTLNFWK